MKFQLIASILAVTVFQTSKPTPQGWSVPSTSWTAPPVGWTAPPAGWNAPPGWRPPTSGWTAAPGWTVPAAAANIGHVVAAGEAVVGQDIASFAGASDHVNLTAVAPLYYDLDETSVNTTLLPSNDLYAGVGSLTASTPNADVYSDDAYVDFDGESQNNNTVVLTDMYSATISSNPTASASSSLGTLNASSFVSISDGAAIPPAPGNGWKQPE